MPYHAIQAIALKHFPSRKQTSAIALSISLAAFSTGCANNGSFQMPEIIKQTFDNDDPCSNNARNIGIAVGSVTIAVLVATLSGKGNKATGAAMGSVVGGLLGGLIGNDIDRRRCELSKVAKANNLELVMTDINEPSDDAGNTDAAGKSASRIGMSVSVTDRGTQFGSGSANPTVQAANAFGEIAKRYRTDVSTAAQSKELAGARNSEIRILLVGHTDDTGSSKQNADLSEARARAIAKIFADQGFAKDQIFYQGAGETLPIADNRTESGRQANRRVEIIDLTNDKTFSAFLAARKPNLAFYRPAEANAIKADSALHSATRKTKQGGGASKAVSNSASKTVTQKEASVLERTAGSVEQPQVPTGNEAGSPPVVKAPVSPSRQAATQSKDGAAISTTIDFGGNPVNNDFVQVEIGKPLRSSMFSIISSAYASVEPPVGSCAQDRPRIANGVKSLRGDQLAELSTGDFVPGLYNTSWFGKVNGHLVALTNVAVLRDGGAPARKPNLLIYRNYADGSNVAATYRSAPEVNTYQGEKALLYRVFAEAPIRCIDVVIPNRSNTAPNSNMIYALNGRLHQVNYAPSIAK